MSHHHKKNHSQEKNSQDPNAEKNPAEIPQAAVKNGKIEVPAQEYEDLKKKVEEIEGLRQKFLLAAADYENAKKRNAREREDFIKFSQERILKDLLPVMDNFERAVGHANTASASATGYEALQQNLKTLLSGVQRVQKQFEDALKLHGLKRIETTAQMFNPHLHEVVAHVPEEGKEDQIVDELEPGYMLYDRLLRAAKVRIRVSPKQQSPAPEEKQEEIT